MVFEYAIFYCLPICKRNEYKCLYVGICSKLLEATSVVFPNWVINHCH